MKYQALFSSKDKIKKFKCRLLQFLFDALRVKTDQSCCQLRSSMFLYSVFGFASSVSSKRRYIYWQNTKSSESPSILDISLDLYNQCSRTPVAHTLMACPPRLFRTRS